ncbi:MAG: methionyl aminopeptidase [Maribacter sp.]|jgi:methionyl aminopeptidase
MRRKSKQIFFKTDEEVELIRENCLIVSKALALVGSILKPGITGEKIDKEAETLIRDLGAKPGFKGLYGFPATLCISVNEGVVHGIPTKKEFKEGDVVSVDCGSYLHGFYGDAAYTFALGEISEEVEELLSVTKTALYKGIENAVHGKRVGDIGFAIQDYCEKQHGYGVVRELVGHGLGKSMHEAPEVPNYGRRGRGVMLKDGLVIAIEPMINLGKRHVMTAKDGWTIITQDKKPSAHYEHSVVVRKKKADILSDHDLIEAEIKNNAEIREILIKK